MLFNEPKLLKRRSVVLRNGGARGFSALQRAEIAEIPKDYKDAPLTYSFSALQRAEIAETQKS